MNRRHVLDVTRSAAPPTGLKRHELVATTAARFQVAEVGGVQGWLEMSVAVLAGMLVSVQYTSSAVMHDGCMLRPLLLVAVFRCHCPGTPSRLLSAQMWCCCQAVRSVESRQLLQPQPESATYV